MKNRLLIGAAALVVVAVPAVAGLWGNASFAQSVPVRVPASGQIAVISTPSPSSSVDDDGGDVPRDQRTEPGDDRDVQGGLATPSSPSPSPSADDNGGDIPRDQRTEPGDDRDVNGSGSDDSESSGSDDDSDDSGGSGHGSDD